MDAPDTIICPNCKTANPLTARTCKGCGDGLAVPKARYYLVIADQDTLAGNYDRARINLSRADSEMFSLSPAQRRQHLLAAHAFLLQAIIYYQKGEIANAHNELELALANVEGVEHGEQLLARILNQLGNVALYENSDAAAEYYQRGGQVALAAGEHGLAATIMGNLGIIHFNNGAMDKALACYITAAKEAELAGDPARRANVYRLLATFYANQGPYGKAIEAMEQALSLLPQITNSAAICRITNTAGRIYLNYGDLAKAESWLLQSDELARQAGNKLTQVENAVALAELMLFKGDYPASLNYTNRAYNPVTITPLQRSAALAQFVTFYLATENHAGVRRYLKLLDELCATDSSSTNLIFLHRANALFAITQSQWDEAEQQFNQALELIQKRNEKYTLAQLQEEYATHLLISDDPLIQARAEELLTQVIATFQELEMPLRVARIEAKRNTDNLATKNQNL